MSENTRPSGAVEGFGVCVALGDRGAGNCRGGFPWWATWCKAGRQFRMAQIVARWGLCSWLEFCPSCRAWVIDAGYRSLRCPFCNAQLEGLSPCEVGS